MSMVQVYSVYGAMTTGKTTMLQSIRASAKVIPAVHTSSLYDTLGGIKTWNMHLISQYSVLYPHIKSCITALNQCIIFSSDSTLLPTWDVGFFRPARAILDKIRIRSITEEIDLTTSILEWYSVTNTSNIISKCRHWIMLRDDETMCDYLSISSSGKLIFNNDHRSVERIC